MFSEFSFAITAFFEFSSEKITASEFSSAEIIKNKIDKKIDLFNRGETYEVVKINEEFPKYLLDNLNKYKDWIVK